MAQKIEKWAASDGSQHDSKEQAEAYDNDLSLSYSLSQFVDSVYSADISANTPFQRLEKAVLTLAIFRNRKILMDVLLRHNAGPTLQLGTEQIVSPPKRGVATSQAPAGSSPSNENTSGIPPVGVPLRPSTPSEKPSGVPDNFLFNNVDKDKSVS